jgi:hypothetical protein
MDRKEFDPGPGSTAEPEQMGGGPDLGRPEPHVPQRLHYPAPGRHTDEAEARRERDESGRPMQLEHERGGAADTRHRKRGAGRRR